MPDRGWETATVKHVVLMNAAPDGKAYTLGFELADGGLLALVLPPREAASVVDALTGLIAKSAAGGRS